MHACMKANGRGIRDNERCEDPSSMDARLSVQHKKVDLGAGHLRGAEPGGVNTAAVAAAVRKLQRNAAVHDGAAQLVHGGVNNWAYCCAVSRPLPASSAVTRSRAHTTLGAASSTAELQHGAEIGVDGSSLEDGSSRRRIGVDGSPVCSSRGSLLEPRLEQTLGGDGPGHRARLLPERA